MRKKLKLTSSDIATYVYESYPLGIMKANGEEYKEWMLSNYIQLNSHDDIIGNKEVFLAFYDDVGIKSPFLKIQHFCWSIMSQYQLNFVEFFKQNIDIGCYLYFKVDEYYIPNRQAYKKYRYLHDIMIIGYDEERFIVTGYDNKGLCREMKIPYSVFMESLNSNKPDISKNEWEDDIFFIKYVKADYKFNIEAVKFALYDYLNSINRVEKSSRFSNPLEDTVYGLDIYDKVVNYLKIIKENGNIFIGGVNIDNRVFRIIMEHKNIMLKRIELIKVRYSGFDDIYNKYIGVDKKATLVHLLAIKYEITANKKILNKLINLVEQIKYEDKEILGELYKRI
ncbi:MAG: hypothetical protein ACRDCW_04085 [Sarcina sp.]